MLRVADTAQLHSLLLDKCSTVTVVDPNAMIFLPNLASVLITALTPPIIPLNAKHGMRSLIVVLN
jgi:hypothetical protein